MDAIPVIIISAPSGSGKNTIIETLVQQGLNIEHSISTTTRDPRPNEVHGKSYYFSGQKKFEEKIKNEDFFEYANVLDHYYGTTKEEILRIQAKGNIPILDIDIQGAAQFKEKYPNVVSVFIMPPSLEELKNRLIQRETETREQIDQRLKLAQEEITHKDHYDHIIINDKLEKAVEELKQIISSINT